MMPTIASTGAAFVPGHFFFVRRVELPAGLEKKERDAHLELLLEELAPFPVEQLMYGYRVTSDGASALLYAAYRKRFDAETHETWSSQAFVLPVFAPLLDLRFAETTLVFLRGKGSLCALSYAAGVELPQRIVSRPCADDCTEEELQNLRELLARRLLGEDAEYDYVEFAEVPELHREGPTVAFHLQSSSGRSIRQTIRLRTEEVWKLDIRDVSVLAQRRKQFVFDLAAWRIVATMAAILLLLLAGELVLAGLKWSTTRQSATIASNRPLVQSVEAQQVLYERLVDFEQSNLLPFEMMAVINPLRPRSISYSRTTTDGRLGLIIEANTRNVSDVNQFESALRNSGLLASVEIRNLSSRGDGTSFTMVLEFSRTVFEQLQAPAGQPFSPSPVSTARLQP